MHPPNALSGAVSPPFLACDTWQVHPARLQDFRDLVLLERVCFEKERRDSPLSIIAALVLPRQEVWIARQAGKRIAGALFLRGSRTGLRIYSLAVEPSCRRGGLGHDLVAFAFERAASLGFPRVYLECSVSHPFLCDWYEKQGFQRRERLPDFYGPGQDACRMVCERSADTGDR